MPGVTGIPRTWTRGTQLRLDRITRLLTAPLPDRYLQQMMGAVYAGLALRHPLRADAAVRAGYSEHYATRQQSRTCSRSAPSSSARSRISDSPDARRADRARTPAVGRERPPPPAKAARRVTVTADRAVAVIPSCGHCPQLDCPSEFLAEVLPFLAR
ncbi:hypothetical protein GS508_17335 [Rhodococcus hoagii]|nr:hypothetical protein [Prescottella equi]